MGCWQLIYKHHRRLFRFLGFWIRFDSRGTKSHWVNPFNCLVDCWRLVYEHHRIIFLLLGFWISVSPWRTKAHWVNPWETFGGFLDIVNKQWKKEELGFIISKNIEYQLVVGSNKDVAAVSLPTLNVNIIEDSEKIYGYKHRILIHGPFN